MVLTKAQAADESTWSFPTEAALPEEAGDEGKEEGEPPAPEAPAAPAAAEGRAKRRRRAGGGGMACCGSRQGGTGRGKSGA